VSHLALSSATIALYLFRIYGRTSVGWLSNFKDNVLSSHNTELRSLIHVLVHSTWREEQDGRTFQHLTDIHLFFWYFCSCLWNSLKTHFIVELTNCSNRIHWQYVQPWRIQLKTNTCSNPQRTRKLMLKLACAQWSEAVDKTTSMLSPVGWVGGYLRVPNKQHIHSIHTCIMNTLAIRFSH